MKKIVPLLLLMPVMALAQWNFGGEKVVKVEAFRSNKQVMVNLFPKKGYGVQKKAPNKVILYKLKPGHHKAKTVKEKVRLFGKHVGTVTRFRGKTAKEDKKYFSRVNSLIFRQQDFSKGDYILESRLYYCSFKDGFCSVQASKQQVL